jgi:radical SAM protein with 4Fe4S-binding SPASM domain
MGHVAENSSAAVSVQYVIQEENVDELVSFVELVAGTPVKSVGFTPMNFAGHQEGSMDYGSLWQRIGLREKWEAAARRGAELGVDVLTLRDRCLCTDNIDVIAADGSLLPCWGNYLVKKHAVGNVFHESPGDIRRKPAYQEWREGLRTGKLPEMCSACWVRGYDL